MRLLITLLMLATLPAAAADLEQLNWLTGCWTYDNDEPGSGEFWMAPIGGSMLAVSRTIKNGRTSGFEYMRIAESDLGDIALYAQPSGKPAVRFGLASLSDTEVSFENPEHDFPQRIIYKSNGDGTLPGRIEGVYEGEAVAVDFPMTGIDCGEFSRGKDKG